MLTLRRAAVVTVVVAGASLSMASAGADQAVPFTDPNAHGFVAFCDEHGHPMTGGRVDAKPFVWKAVSSFVPPSGYLGKGENAALTIYQPRQDLVGISTMEFCRRWGLVGAVEAAPYPRDLRQDNVYVTSLAGYELGRERFPSMGDAKPPPESPQKRERCPQNMFDPVLRAFAAAPPSVELRYRTRLIGFTQAPDHVTAQLEDVETGRRYETNARYIAGCDGARSRVRDTLGISMSGNPALTHTTNIIFRCPHLVSLHDKGEAYRFIILGPEGTWSTIVAINGRDQ